MLEGASAAEKIGVVTGIMTLLGGIGIAFVKTVRFFAHFSEEHMRFLEYMARAEPMAERIASLEEGARMAATERHELLEEIRGLRRDINDVLKLLASRGE
jgi:hypothetical protein